MESGKNLCVLCLDHFNVPAGPAYKTLKEWIPCLYNRVIDCLFGETSQPANDCEVQTLRLNTSQLPLIKGPTVH